MVLFDRVQAIHRKFYDEKWLTPQWRHQAVADEIERQRRIDASDPAELDYQDFLDTTYWHNLSTWLKDCAGWKCERCGVQKTGPKHLQAHHKTYAHRGREYPDHLDDLIVLCAGCHRKEHGLPTFDMADITPEDLRAFFWQ